MGIVSITEALRLAGEADVDLVEIVAQADPPVCRPMDYGKFKYQEQMRAAGAKSKTVAEAIALLKGDPVKSQLIAAMACIAASMVARLLPDHNRRFGTHRTIGRSSNP